MADMRASFLSQTSESSRSRYTTHYTVEKKKVESLRGKSAHAYTSPTCCPVSCVVQW